MKCSLCDKDAETRSAINGLLAVCSEHFKILARLEEQYKKRFEVRRRALEKQSYNKTRYMKQRTRYATYLMILAGAIVKKPCEVCGNEKADTHHDDYNDPEKNQVPLSETSCRTP